MKTDVAILCGGVGSRLRPLTDHCPKCMVTVGQKPFLAILLDYIASHGFKRAVLCTGYLGEVVRDYVSGYDKMDIILS